MRILLLSACLFVGGVAQAANDLPGGGIDAEALSRHVRLLASDEFEGRAPASAGEQRTVDYLVEQFKAADLEPGGEQGGWTQAVPLVRAQVDGPVRASLRVGGKTQALVNGSDVTLQSLRPQQAVALKNAPLVFVGYGISAPERQWDDYKGVDLRGKIAVVLINDADFESPQPGAFDGKAVTYYGRWTYKYEEAARRGRGVDRARDSAGGVWLGHGAELGHVAVVRYRAQRCRCPRAARAGAWLDAACAGGIVVQAGRPGLRTGQGTCAAARLRACGPGRCDVVGGFQAQARACGDA
ncbi:exported hypothetical protein [Xanthomonas citri pv. citri]|nr:exported hypothetical protein [Xanthomonas citri pv. citri]CEE73668.1 exported hypothetical protein [Xanthomonas citri pv. citri]CEL35037.1 exported hypothetical protein [Xanthomonas citri pv. citri]CEL42266.1 exported hypothetical protein [Xanthomonas citri pv. citri]